mmetsp:Transcript_101492/g.217316  ORF Transcript_101492/g.217316 Transcript_101492/m.217316 type:complete len:226 (-) Transcript_101492:12-689(-)
MALRMPSHCHQNAHTVLFKVLVAAALMGGGRSFLAFLGAPRVGPLPGRPQLARQATLQMAVTEPNQDLVKDAVATAVYDMWVDEYPVAAKTGEFFGRSVSKASLADRAANLREGLGLGWAEVLGLVSTDSLVLLAESEQVSHSFHQLGELFGSREAALDMVRRQPLLLLVSSSKLKSADRTILQASAELSDATRPFYRAVRAAAMHITTASIFPKPTDVAGIAGR